MGIFLSLTVLILISVTASAIPYSAPETYSFQTEERPAATTVIGIILKSGDKFVLSDTATKSKYFLDDLERAKRILRASLI